MQRLDNTIHRINHYPAESVVCSVNIYPLDSDLSGGYRYPAFEQLGPGPSIVIGEFSHDGIGWKTIVKFVIVHWSVSIGVLLFKVVGLRSVYCSSK